MKAINRDRDIELATRVECPAGWFSRALGLMFRRTLAEGSGMLLAPCQGIHTIGMRFSIDALFLDRDGRIVRAYRTLSPFRVTRLQRAARSVLELPAGTVDRTGTLEGDRIEMVP